MLAGSSANGLDVTDAASGVGSARFSIDELKPAAFSADWVRVYLALDQREA